MKTSTINFASAFESCPLAPGFAVAVACSGGVDSMVLLDLVARSELAKTTPVAVFHVNHGQQAHAASAEGAVREAARDYGFPFFSETLKLAPGQSEATLRTARFEAFSKLWDQWLKKNSSVQIHPVQLLLAHHADDQLEGLIFRLMRGAHPETLKPMAVASTRGEFRLLRPLLKARKSEIDAYAKVHGVRFVEDPSNSNTQFARNAIRHRLIPLLEELRPKASEKILRFLLEVDKNNRNRAGEEFPESETISDLMLGKPVPLSAVDHQTLRTTVMRALGAAADRATLSQWENLKRSVALGQINGERRRLQFPGGFEVVIHRKTLRFLRGGT